jgi:methyl-accepting chemotaxis protein
MRCPTRLSQTLLHFRLTLILSEKRGTRLLWPVNPGTFIYWFVHWIGLSSFAAYFNWTIILGAVILAHRVGGRELRVSHDVEDLARHLGDIKDPKVALRRVDEWFSTHHQSPLVPLWREYQAAREATGSSHPKVQPDILRYFSSNNIQYVAANLRAVEAAPTILTMAGILGTFVALVVGLHGLNVNQQNGLSQGISQLIAGLSLKFTSSVLGILLALIWILIERYGVRAKLLHRIHLLQVELDQAFQVPTEELLLQELRELQSEATTNLDTLVSDKFLPQVVEGVRTALHDEVGARLQDFGERITNISGDVAASHMDQLERVLDGFIDKLGQGTERYFARLGDTLQTTVATQERLLSSLSTIADTADAATARFTDAADQAAALLEAVGPAVERFQGAFQAWSDIQDTFSHTVGALQQAIQDFQGWANVFGEVMETLKLHYDGVREWHAHQVEEWRAALDQIQALSGTLNAAVDRVAGLDEAVAGAVAKLTGELDATTGNIATEFEGSLRRALQLFEEELVTALRHLDGGIEHLGDLVTSIQVPSEQLERVVHELDTLATAIEAVRRGVSQVVEALEPTRLVPQEAVGEQS